MTITQLVTHSGGFHADELLSSVILTRLFPDATVLRSRDKALITPAEGRIIYDVGGDFDAEAGIFDHHQRPNPLREDGQPYSSFGLIWAHYGHDYLRALDVPEADVSAIHDSFDRGFVLPIDLVDDRAFAAALPIARAFVEASIRRKAAKFRAEAMVMTAIDAAGEGHVLDLPMGMPFRGAVVKAGADHLLFVIHPRGEEWTLTTIRSGDDTFENRADLPVAWAGQKDAALEEASGVKGAKFCHNGRFIAVADSREAILQMADIAVKEALAA